MDRRKRIAPASKVGLALSAEERKLIFGLRSLNAAYAEILRNTPAARSPRFTLDEWEDICGYLVAQSAMAASEELRRALSALFQQIVTLLQAHAAQRPPSPDRDVRGLAPSAN